MLTAILDDSQLKQSVTFMSLKPRMTELLLRFLNAETDAANIQMLLGNCHFMQNMIGLFTYVIGKTVFGVLSIIMIKSLQEFIQFI